MKLAPIFLFIFLILIATASAVKPTIQSSISGNGQIEIVYPKLEYIKIGVEEQLHFHVFNSTGHLLKNDTTSCNIHIYNASDEHVAQSAMSMDSNSQDYNYVWNITGLAKGTYPYVVFCNNTREGGFLSDSFEINHDGKIPGEPSFPIAIIILLPLVLAFLLIHGAASMTDEHVTIKISAYLLAPIFFMLSFHLSMISVVKFYDWPVMEDLIGSSTYWIGIGVLGLLITYFIIYLFVKTVRQAAQEKEEQMRY